MENQNNEVKKTSNKKVIFIGLVVLIVVGMIGGYMYWIRTPQYSLNQIKTAVEQHDIITFKKYVDIDTLASRAIDKIIAKEMGESTDGTQALAAGFVEMIKPKIVEITKDQIKAYIEKGDFEKAENDTEVSVENLYENVGGEGVEFRGIDKIEKSGNIALIDLKSYNKEFEEELTLQLKMRKVSNYWQVTEVNNLSSYMNEIEELEAQKLAKLNKPIIKELNNSLSYESIEIQKIPGDDWGFGKEVYFPVTIKFLTDKNITELGATITAKDKQGNVLLEMPVKSTGSTYKGKVSVVKWGKDINPYIEEDEILYNTPANQLNLLINTDYLVYEDGTKVQLYKGLP